MGNVGINVHVGIDEIYKFNMTKSDSIFFLYSVVQIVIYQWMAAPKILQPVKRRAA